MEPTKDTESGFENVSVPSVLVEEQRNLESQMQDVFISESSSQAKEGNTVVPKVLPKPAAAPAVNPWRVSSNHSSTLHSPILVDMEDVSGKEVASCGEKLQPVRGKKQWVALQEVNPEIVQKAFNGSSVDEAGKATRSTEQNKPTTAENGAKRNLSSSQQQRPGTRRPPRQNIAPSNNASSIPRPRSHPTPAPEEPSQQSNPVSPERRSSHNDPERKRLSATAYLNSVTGYRSTAPARRSYTRRSAASFQLQQQQEAIAAEYHRQALQAQIEYYFSVENLCRDIYLRAHMDAEGWIPVDFIASFNRVRVFTTGMTEESITPMIATFLAESQIVEVREDFIRKQGDWQNWILPEDMKVSILKKQELKQKNQAALEGNFQQA